MSLKQIYLGIRYAYNLLEEELVMNNRREREHSGNMLLEWSKREPVRLSANVFSNIRRTIGSRSPEWGGMLGSSDGGRTIDAFVLDYKARTTGSEYAPDVKMLNSVLEDWDRQGILPVGMIHSHPHGCTVPSKEDIHAATTYMKAVPAFCGKFELPIVQTDKSPDGFRIFWYTAIEETSQRSAHIIPREATVNGVKVSVPYAEKRKTTMTVPEDVIFSRISELFPLETARKKTVVVVGAGGSRGFLSQLARIGIGRYILIDADRIEPYNIGTQGVYADEIGLMKVNAAAEELRRIDPYCRIDCVPRMLDDKITDSQFEQIVGKRLFSDPKDILLCAFTDSFRANGRTASLAVKYGTPFLQGLVYQYGTGVEIIFSYPGVTPACPRCCQNTRYDANLYGKVKNVSNVSSNCPVSATAILNAYKLEIAEQLLFYGEHSPYSDKLRLHAENNLLFVRLSEKLPDCLNGSTFDRATRTSDGQPIIGGAFYDRITPDGSGTDAPVCPLCGGSGNLLDSLGQPFDTRILS